MYESFTYNQIKDLPEDQKVEALKELKTMYPDNKDLAKHWDVAFIAANNMIGKYLEGKQVGRKKMTPEEKAQAKLQRETEKKLKEQQTSINVNEASNTESVIPEKSISSITQEIQSINTTSFSIKLQKEILGEEATTILNSIANTLLKEGKYKVSLSIEELEV